MYARKRCNKKAVVEIVKLVMPVSEGTVISRTPRTASPSAIACVGAMARGNVPNKWQLMFVMETSLRLDANRHAGHVKLLKRRFKEIVILTIPMAAINIVADASAMVLIIVQRKKPKIFARGRGKKPVENVKSGVSFIKATLVSHTPMAASPILVVFANVTALGHAPLKGR